MKTESVQSGLPDRCYIFGAGSFGKGLVEVLKTYNVEVVGILDNKTTGSWSGLEIMNPRDADNSI